jgi:hypothetical protein
MVPRGVSPTAGRPRLFRPLARQPPHVAALPTHVVALYRAPYRDSVALTRTKHRHHHAPGYKSHVGPLSRKHRNDHATIGDTSVSPIIWLFSQLPKASDPSPRPPGSSPTPSFRTPRSKVCQRRHSRGRRRSAPPHPPTGVPPTLQSVTNRPQVSGIAHLGHLFACSNPPSPAASSVPPPRVDF